MHTTTSKPSVSAVSLQGFVLLQENKVLEQYLNYFLLCYMQKVTENYLSKVPVTRYFHFVSSQHCIKH